jgi:hypothetical protein
MIENIFIIIFFIIPIFTTGIITIILYPYALNDNIKIKKNAKTLSQDNDDIWWDQYIIIDN